MDEVYKWLKSYGLNDTEIKVYACILGHPETKVVDIQRQTGLVRTTIYYTLAQLKSGGLISENTQNNIKTYRAADSAVLKQNIESEITQQQNKLSQFDGLKTIFDQLQTRKPDSASFVARYEGIGPIKQAIEQAMRCESKHWYIIAARDNFLYHTSKQYKQYYLAERKRRGITAKTLWEPTDDFRPPSVEDMFYRNPRRLPEEFLGAFKSLVILYDDTTLIIDPYGQKTAHAIHNATSTQLLRLVLNLIWKTAKQSP